MEIQVTKEHIDAGAQGKATNCPVALAMSAAGLNGPLVEDDRLSHFNTGAGPRGRRYYTNDASLSRWIRSFDDGMTVPPMTLVIPEAGSGHLTATAAPIPQLH